jgi:hypothetical protein
MHLAADFLRDLQPVLVNLVALVSCKVIQLLTNWSFNARISFI